MDSFELLFYCSVVTTTIVTYLIFFKGRHRTPGWKYYFKYLIALNAVKRWKSQKPWIYLLETPRGQQSTGWDCVTVRASAPDGSTVLLAIRKLYHEPNLAETTVFVRLADGTTYRLPNHPDTVVGEWEYTEWSWAAGGLKIETLVHMDRLRILFNGLLKKDDGITQHVRFNFIWASASLEVQYPEQWSDELAAKALALEPWRDSCWPNMPDKYEEGSWLQWGTVQGRFESYTSEGTTDRSEYLRVRGVRERSWSPQGYEGLRRNVSLVACAKDGTAVQLRGFSYKDVFTAAFSGCVRFPDSTVEMITDTDLVLEEFCEHPKGIPKVYTINIKTKKRHVFVMLRINPDGGRFLSGVPYQLEVICRTVDAEINGEVGTGILELGYQVTEKSEPPLRIPPQRLRWASRVSGVGYCAPFEDKVAASPDYVGGKGASLALLASVQNEMGYRVPPGFCLTTKALQKHLEANPLLRSAIKEIEAANENYDENNFKDKCNKASDLFAKTEIVKEVRDDILHHLSELRKKAAEQNLGPELRFAVRSSAVGEDSEALSAAGQNETILGCVSDDDVLRGVQLCWGSMFAFTSAHYRRQNGQLCECRAGVVVQALVSARAAGVMFTRHPAAGDPSQLLITANYGLGETVVSGSVEPDTIVIFRGKELSISKIELGSKKQRVTAGGGGVTTEQVSEEEQRLPCISEAEALALAKIGIAQEEAWGAGRDIEWAVTEDEIFLLQARPITSLERWTEEELLHELDTAIMSDDDLISFANTGEVLPKALSALSYDIVNKVLIHSINCHMTPAHRYDVTMAFSHNRVALNMYNSLYRFVSEEIDMGVRMMEMSICGHKVIDDQMHRVAKHRRPPSRKQRWLKTITSFKWLLTTKWAMDHAVKMLKDLKLDVDTEDPMQLLETLADQEQVLYQCGAAHVTTSSASSVSQLIAMAVLTEGASDFSNDQCNEIATMLSSGEVLSAEVPQALARIANHIDQSGQVDAFRAQNPKNALDWLNKNLPEVHREVCQFLQEHGHRAIMEFDLSTKPWALVPEEMMEVLQNMRGSNEERQLPTAKTDDEIIASLKTPQKSSTRKLLRWLLPLCRRTVRHRESTKSQLILMIHKLRLAYLQLGKLLVKRWYLPEEDLVFHFRLHEMRYFLLTRDPALLRKAIQRRQYNAAWCKLKFAETNKGWVEPVKSRGPVVTAGDVSIRATAACGGEVVARACVVKELSEIGQLQKGDVLITHSTDIGWSPYFPLLTGIVTELGGLISHGAVIAREYGLPCLVGAVDATDMFRTGDTVRLSAKEGILERVKVDGSANEDSTQN
ncbi:putative phosphoenolpyruvate synthase [Pectinophora gossypiella]|uniref:putative phosphoenolpyruvate synthase n=1 Tax=Pectinophora gossypiella TaxID=13191 RepID=UPI00214F340C|nr:putative phosphoenolpyruvate synthase [Pectinophora gossypiella]